MPKNVTISHLKLDTTMSHKKRKLTKLNKKITQIFGGVGFDEGIVNAPEPYLKRMILALDLPATAQTKKEMLKQVRRIWSEGDYPTRLIMVNFLEAFPFKAKKMSFEARVAKLRNVCEPLDLAQELFDHVVRASKHLEDSALTWTNVQKLVQQYEQVRLRKAIQTKEKITFDDHGGFFFTQTLPITIGDTTIHKHFTLTVPPITDYDAIAKAKEEAIAPLQEKITTLETTLQNHPYLSNEQILRYLQGMSETNETLTPSINYVDMQRVLRDHANLRHFHEQLLHMVITIPFTFNHQHFVTFAHLDKETLSQNIWEGKALNLDKRMQRAITVAKTIFILSRRRLFKRAKLQSQILNFTPSQLRQEIMQILTPMLQSSKQLRLTPKVISRTLARFEQRIAKAKEQKQREILLARTVRDFKNLFGVARSLKRTLIFNVGPTNSGKTYQALQTLKHADTGYYLAPLRLLALEGYETLQEAGVDVSLVTGEEQILAEDATHISSTIEMLNFDIDVDVCVIDEVQMIADMHRGWAWANAIIGAPAHEVIMTGSADALPVIQALAKWLDEELIINHFERKTPLQLIDKNISFEQLMPKTAIITFSRKSVLYYQQKLSPLFKTAVIYGNLSPEVRREEARRFRSGEAEVLIATDAIAMGLNLPIKTILFATDTKFDGQSDRLLTPSEVQQIAGRSGRYGHHEEGYVGALSFEVLQTISMLLPTPLVPIELPVRVMVNFDHIKLVGSILQTERMSEILEFLVKHMRFDGPFEMADLDQMLEIAYLCDDYELTLQEKYHFITAPVSLGSAYLMEQFRFYIEGVANGMEIPYEGIKQLGSKAHNSAQLLQAEEYVKEITTYLWLSFRLSDHFIDTAIATQTRTKLNAYIENSLKSGAFARACRECGATIPTESPHAICDKCFKKRRRKRYR
jgi:ATP-dependent RNA helicase SUPV3L1/SUV3